MLIPPEWRIKANNKVNEILKEAADCGLFKIPIPITDIIESYVGDVQIAQRLDIPFPESTSAFSTKDMHAGWIVAINEREVIERQRFSAGHELAHMVLFPNQPKTVYCSANSKTWDERLCDEFSGNILMPEVVIREIYKTTPAVYIEDIAKIFKVSLDVAKIQLKKLGLSFAVKVPKLGGF